MSKFMHHDGSFMKADSARIYYEELGNKNGPALLMLHGGFGTMEDFNPIVSPLVKEFRIIGMDGRGQGKSTLGERKLTYQQMQLDAESLLDHLGINEVIVIGFSDGGMVGHLMALSNVLKIKKLIVIGTP
jgi:pimeloyl-ACP methyl ester carboxylesterase